ncbi:MAG: hypothetical protein KatS3mg111_3135 [Pirellulaceae bacterium]|nr:MAG: hypothetical protein KatS3mg111_3135 [Pirellulaceae bacterium]
MREWQACWGLVMVAIASWIGVAFAQEKEADQSRGDAPSKPPANQVWTTSSCQPDKEGWRPLLPPQGLSGWEITDYGERGVVRRDGEQLIIEAGDPLNGITYLGKDFPKENFEIYLEASRLEGRDFFCGLTFPVGEEFCSLIAGGWGGTIVGLSSVDGFDASENATTTAEDFENDRWYRFLVRVDDEYVRVWIDGEEFFRQEREGHEFSTRIEVYANQPLGLATFMTKAAVRNFRWRPLAVSPKSAPSK